jgi:hypothetical protein
MKKLWLILVIVSAVFSKIACAAPFVDYTVSGSSGNWTLDFTVHNTLNAPMDIDFWGIQLSQNMITGNPGSFVPSIYTSWVNIGQSTTVFNNNWYDPTHASLPAGAALSGFKVQVTDLIVPDSVSWFAYAIGFGGGPGVYTGSDYFYVNTYPGFEGMAAASVPEGGVSMVLAFCLCGLIWLRRYTTTAPTALRPSN